MDSVEWGQGEGVGTDGRGGSAAGPSSSVCALVVLSVGGRYAWVVHRGHCLRALGCWWARGCCFVVRGHGGDVSSAVWSSLARLEGRGLGALTIDGSIDNNNE